MRSGQCETNFVIDSLFDDHGMFESVGDGTLSIPPTQTDVSASIDLNGRSSACESQGSYMHLQLTEEGNSNNTDGGAAICLESDDEWIPKEGAVVQKIIEGFIRYSNFGRRNGFEIRFRSSERSTRVNEIAVPLTRRRMKRGLSRNWFYSDYDDCSRVRIQCVKGEKPRLNRRDPNKAVRSQATGCKAGVTLVNIGDGGWMFKKVVLDHNHECDISSTRFMLNYRMVSGADEMQIINGDRAGVSSTKIYSTFAVGHGGFQKVPFSITDCHTVIRNSRAKRFEAGDFNAMQKLFSDMSGVSDDFFYLYDTDVEGRVKNVFWADGRSRAAYRDFGDVVCFDTTHLKNRYKMPLAPFIGVNHHGQSILLGIALLSNEDTKSFCWVFEAWLKCMHNIAPKCIMTDQCASIGNAIGKTLPLVRHRWCLWHVMRNAVKHLRRIPQWEKVRKALKEAVHDTCEIEVFESTWMSIIDEFNLQRNEWLRTMYESRQKWVPVYFLHEFWAGMHTTQRSEGMNNFFRSYVNVNTGLRQFAEQYCLFVGKRIDDEERENWKSTNKPSSCVTRLPTEVILQKVYTGRKFVEVQNEVKGVVYTKVEQVSADDDDRIFTVTDKGVEKVYGDVVTRTYMVQYSEEGNATRCSCKKFSFMGIICRHMIAVWQEVDLRTLPPQYIVDRWRKDVFRQCSIVKIPNYSIGFEKSEAYMRHSRIHSIMREISNMALGCDALYDSLMGGLEVVREKCQEFVNDSIDVNIDTVGRIYKRREDGDCINEVEQCVTAAVLDPIDRRGRGRVPTKRKGGGSGNRKRQTKKQKETPVEHVFFV